VFLTNNFMLPAPVIAEIYKQRWQVELFFKWVKQHLRIKTFYGTSINAVKSQIWVGNSQEKTRYIVPVLHFSTNTGGQFVREKAHSIYGC
jgi:hypothetical protein